MTMTPEKSLRVHLERMHEAMTELETAARKLKNQNFADIVRSAHGKIHQLTQHPDLAAVHKHLEAGSEDQPHRSHGGAAEGEGAQAVSGKADAPKGFPPFPS